MLEVKLCFLPDKPAREAIIPGTFFNLKTYAHVGQADMGREAIALPTWAEIHSKSRSNVVQSSSSKGPLLACPAGAEVFQLTPTPSNHRLPVWLAQPEGKFLTDANSTLHLPRHTASIPPSIHLDRMAD